MTKQKYEAFRSRVFDFCSGSHHQQQEARRLTLAGLLQLALHGLESVSPSSVSAYTQLHSLLLRHSHE